MYDKKTHSGLYPIKNEPKLVFFNNNLTLVLSNLKK